MQVSGGFYFIHHGIAELMTESDVTFEQLDAGNESGCIPGNGGLSEDCGLPENDCEHSRLMEEIKFEAYGRDKVRT
jgi:hypothetical protein